MKKKMPLLELFEMFGNLKDMKENGYTVVALKKQGYSAAEMREVGFRLPDLQDGGYTMKELQDGGFDAEMRRSVPRLWVKCVVYWPNYCDFAV